MSGIGRNAFGKLWRLAVGSAIAVTLICSGLPVAVARAGDDEAVDLDIVKKIKDEEQNRSQVMDLVGHIADVCGPRLTGSPGIRAAEKWTVDQLGEWGAANVHLEAWGPFGRGWSLEGFTANMVRPAFSPLIAYPRAWSPGTNGPVRGQPIYLDAANDTDLARYKGRLKGAIVLVGPPRELKPHFEPLARRATDEELLRLANAGPPGTSRRYEPTAEQRAAAETRLKNLQLVYAEGASVVLEPGRGDGGTLFVTSAAIPPRPDAPDSRWGDPWTPGITQVIPQAVIAAEHYNRIVRLLARHVPVELEINIASRFYDDDLMDYNVIAEIPGTDLKDEIVMLGGCLDSWQAGTGATDNAAGVAVCLEVMRIFKALGLRPRRTIRIGLWSGEEQGRLGSRAYVAAHFGSRVPRDPAASSQARPPGGLSEPGAEYEKFSGYFNLDDGTGRIRGIYMQGNENVRPIFRAWLAPLKELGASTLTLAGIDFADNYSFDDAGLPGFMFIRDEIEYGTRTGHSNMDVFDHVLEEDLRQAAIVTASFVYNTAMRDQKLPRVRR